MNYIELKKQIINGDFDTQIILCSGKEQLASHRQRYIALLDCAHRNFKDNDYHIFSSPGRTEVGGNHTDHQRGRVLAASVNRDILAVVTPCDDYIEVISDGYIIKPIHLNDIEYRQDEENTSEALIRGIVARFVQLGYHVGGFKALCTSNVLKGSGISSSAAFEVLIGTILSHLYNDGQVSAVDIAKISQYAENKYFGKPCGLMDQMACSVGGFVTIDFFDQHNPLVEKIDFDFSKFEMGLVLVDTKGDHAELSGEYATMPKEMKDVAKLLGHQVMSEISGQQLLANIAKLRGQVSDRAILRALHFVNETKRVVLEVEALKHQDKQTFNNLVIESGYSSYMYLQNVIVAGEVETQELALALAVSEQILKNHGAYRVHGGGLAGTIQAFVPLEMIDNYREIMDGIFGEGACFLCEIRSVGGYKIV